MGDRTQKETNGVYLVRAKQSILGLQQGCVSNTVGELRHRKETRNRPVKGKDMMEERDRERFWV